MVSVRWVQDHQLLTSVAASASNSIFEHWFRNWMAAMVWNYYHNQPSTSTGSLLPCTNQLLNAILTTVIIPSASLDVHRKVILVFHSILIYKQLFRLLALKICSPYWD